MAFCASCGAAVEGRFCAKCGATVQAPPVAGPPPGYGAPPPSGYAAPAASAGMTDNVAGLLCYLAGFITGILFLVIEPYNKNRAVRFHAFQSIFLNVAIIVIYIVLGIFTTMLAVVHLGMLFAVIGLLYLVLWLAILALWIYMMVAAYQGKQVELPVIGALARKQAGA